MNLSCSFEGAKSILEVALNNNIALNHSCGGMGSCTTCRVKVTKGLEKLKPPNEIEQEHIQAREFAKNERLSCQTDAVDGVEVEIPEATE
ncbi:MAG: (2Fe-2S)-binding protein [Oligoflexia bacterium]|nr:(2Fe-2S)-binding protein [Oligoflexia bacterium]